MAQSWIETEPTVPWTLRVSARLPFAPYWTSVAIGLGYLVLVVIRGLATGTFSDEAIGSGPFWEQPGWWTVFVNAAMVSLGPTVMLYSLLGTTQDVRDLQPALGCSNAELERCVQSATRLSKPLMRFWGISIMLITLVGTSMDPVLSPIHGRPPLTDPQYLFAACRHAFIGWWMARAIYVDITTARAFSNLAQSLRQVDLLDLRPLLPFTRRGVRSVLFWMTASAILSLFWLGPHASPGNPMALVWFVGVAGVTLSLPLGAVHRRIRSQKHAELERIRSAIRADQAVLLEDAGSDAAAASQLPALVAAEARVASVREWPFDASTVARFALYVSVGVGSWLGGALVERLLGTVLD